MGSKIVLIGCGAVGATFAYTVLLKGLANSLVIIDANEDKALGDILDLNHGQMFASPTRITAGHYADCADAEIVVITAGAAQRPGETRIDLMKRNVAVTESIVRQVTAYNQSGILLIVTNPVDILTQVALKTSGWPKNRVIGSGTLLDCSRFRYLVSQAIKVDPRNVHGWIVGEHGDSEVPIWSSLSVAGIKLTESSGRWHLSEEQKEEICRETRNAAYRVIEKKGATYYAIALALARICEAIMNDQRSVLPVSTLVEDYCGVSGVCIGVPCVIGRNGVEEVLELPMSPDEIERFQHSASVIRAHLAEIGYDQV
jgi:L-lactate dehydrogenase